MRLLLGPVLAFHWMAVFGMLAVVSTIDPGGGAYAALELLGVSFAHPGLHGSIGFSAFLALGFALVTALFFWTLLASVFAADRRRDAEDVARYSFAAGAVALTALLLAGAIEQVEGLFVAVGTLLGALAVSYVAVVAEHRSVTAAPAPAEDEPQDTIRAMAAGAAHNALLARLSGRNAGPAEEPRP